VSMKKALALALLGILVLCCVSSADGVTIRVSGLDPEDKHAAKLIQLFEETHPGIKIDAAPLPPTGKGTNWEIKHTQDFVAGVAPDVILAYGVKLYDWAQTGLLLDLMPFAERDGLDLSQYEEQALGQYVIGTKVFALPTNVSTSLMYYSKDMVNEAGLVFPSKNWTWDEFRHYARKLTIRDQDQVRRYGVGFQGTLLYFNPWLKASGGRFFDPEDPYHILLDQPESLRALEFLNDLVQEETLNVSGVWWGPFAEEQYAMLFDGTWLLMHFLDLPVPFELGVAPLPVGPEGPGAFLNSSAVVVSAVTKDPQAAWEFASFVAGEQNQRRTLDYSVRGIPSLAPLWSEWVNVASAQYPQARDALSIVVDPFIKGYTVPEPFFVKDNLDIRRQIDAALQRIWAGEAPPKVVMEQLVPVLNEQLRTR